MSASLDEPAAVRAKYEETVRLAVAKAIELLSAAAMSLRELFEKLLGYIRDESATSKALLSLLSTGRADLDDNRVMHLVAA